MGLGRARRHPEQEEIVGEVIHSGAAQFHFQDEKCGFVSVAHDGKFVRTLRHDG